MDLKICKRKGNFKICERKGKRVQQQTFELLDEIAWEILTRLPVVSLARFKTVSKAWLAIISDPSFVRAHLHCSKQKQHRNPSSFLITPKNFLKPGFSTNIHIYQWSLREGMTDSATLLFGRNFPAGEFEAVSAMAHCDGLILLPTNNKVYVFNPATKDATALPESRRNMMGHHSCLPVGLGLDTSTGKYKVARAFYRCRDYDPMQIITMGMEVFTINGEHGSWRETLVDPPYPVSSLQTGIHYNGCLFYFINRDNQQHTPQALLRFSDETFGVTPLLPNMYPEVEDDEIFVNVLGGELCATFFSKLVQRILICTTRDVVDPDWDFRYVINIQDQFYPMASLGSGRIILQGGNFIINYNLEAQRAEEGEILDMDDIRYVGPNEDTLGRAWENVRWFDTISYTESLVPVTSKVSSQAL